MILFPGLDSSQKTQLCERYIIQSFDIHKLKPMIIKWTFI